MNPGRTLPRVERPRTTPVGAFGALLLRDLRRGVADRDPLEPSVGADEERTGVALDGGPVLGIEAQHVRGANLVPPDAPRVAPHATVGCGPGDVARQVLAPAFVGEDAQCARKLLGDGQLPADAGTRTGLAHESHATSGPGPDCERLRR